MITSNDDNATSWRDLTDQLTPDQVAELEYCEREQVPPGMATAQGHLNCARKMAEINLARKMYADIAPPADAVEVDEWSDWDDDVYERMFTSWTSSSGVSLVGGQFSDGTVERHILCDHARMENLSALEARQIAADLIAAATRLEQLL